MAQRLDRKGRHVLQRDIDPFGVESIAVDQIIFELLLLPFRLFWWAFKHDFGLLEEPPERAGKSARIGRPTRPHGIWDRDLDGPELIEPRN
jgi:hypothetical protein